MIVKENNIEFDYKVFNEVVESMPSFNGVYNED